MVANVIHFNIVAMIDSIGLLYNSTKISFKFSFKGYLYFDMWEFNGIIFFNLHFIVSLDIYVCI